MNLLQDAIEADIAAGTYDGAVTIVAQGGNVLYRAAQGFADRRAGRPLAGDSVFPLFSIAKSYTAVTVLQMVERGRCRLNQPVADVVPAFGARGKQNATIGQLLCHMAGVGPGFPAVDFAHLGDLEKVVAAVCDSPPVSVPGTAVSYAPMMAHAVAAEVVRRLDGGTRRFREIMAEGIFRPLGLADTTLGMRADLVPRAVTMRKADDSPGLFDLDGLVTYGEALLDPENDWEIPAGGIMASAGDVFRFAEALRGGGCLDGDPASRILSPAMLAFATANHTGDLPNDLWHYARSLKGWPIFPANLGLGFFLRGQGMIPTYFGHLASPGTFGGLGAGSTLFWVDPARDMTFVCLTTGVMEEANSCERFQRLSDAAIAQFWR
ncbi:serine hydrolase domain-containing protein [Marinibaculum pumilum]|uniref:Serine hydrolase domain-containing protein n=1 Tax=Marinibaculum pumilum TaxID=1766165 RepID=A0ABV7L8R1_9PROT